MQRRGVTIRKKKVRPASATKRRGAAKPTPTRAGVSEDGEIDRLRAELREALEQQAATAEVLQVVSRSTFDLKTVLSTVVESAARLCLADQAALFLREGDVYRMATTYGFPVDAGKSLAPLRIDRTSMTGRVALAGQAIHVHDVLADPEYRAAAYQQAFGYRTNLGVPLLRDGATIGVFALVRSEVNPFTDKQIELVTTFADQAVIAIENARLFDEVQARTHDLEESLARQTATSEILRAISQTPTDVQPVFNRIVETAAGFPNRGLCGCQPENIDRGTLKAYMIDHALRVGRGQEPAHLERARVRLRLCNADFQRSQEKQDDRRDFGETRMQAIGQADDDILFVVYTDRGDVRHIISARLASRKERITWHSFAEQWKASGG